MRDGSNEETEAVNDISSPTKSGRGYCGYLRDTGHCDNDDNDHSLKPATSLDWFSLAPWVFSDSTYCTVN